MAELLQSFSGNHGLPENVLEQLGLYLELLLRWNARTNLTAIRDPEQIVTRHFGESLLAARLLFPQPQSSDLTAADVGSGAGFPGIPIKLWAPKAMVTLLESQNKKATFLREVLRALKLERAEVFCGRAESWGQTADLVTLRAVEHFEKTLPLAARLVRPKGRLCLLIGSSQLDRARGLLPGIWTWRDPVTIPMSTGRVTAIAERC
ncbi:MAG TPA: 16S rRNA (guanine(527)-N(7))-methyltransferase RsmG [Terriglobales bacterium]|nr:16S rRNA (guanine(527)-N(7))-methyltransferase RsmG [Terriglobales bacterium]